MNLLQSTEFPIEKQQVIDLLNSAIEGVRVNNDTGICVLTAMECNGATIDSSLFKHWPHYSGDIDYPVPGQYLSARETYYNYPETPLEMAYYFWGDNFYGNMRKDLARWIVRGLKDGTISLYP